MMTLSTDQKESQQFNNSIKSKKILEHTKEYFFKKINSIDQTQLFMELKFPDQEIKKR